MSTSRSESAVQVVVPLHLRLELVEYLDLFGEEPHAFLLESTLLDARQGRYSFLGGPPVATLEARLGPGQDGGHRLRLRRGDLDLSFQGDPLPALRGWLSALRPLPTRWLPEVPFLGGAIGYLGYELLAPREHIPFRAPEDGAPPDMLFAFVDEVLAVDHVSGQAFLSVTARAPTEAQAEWRAELRVFELVAALRRREHRPAKLAVRDPAPAPLEFESDLDQEAYQRAVQTAQEHISAGDAFEVCLSRRMESGATLLAAETLYRALREESPSPFAAYLRFPEAEIVAASPERFLRLDERRRVESRPIKGTRPRDPSQKRDLELRNELATSEKDRAENLMIVDLVRSDLGRVAKLGSVAARELLRVEAYRTVYQLVSTVTAELRDGLDLFDLLEATFPGGSMTGAPKIEAMKIISGLEATRRGIYSGALGYIDHRGTSDLAMIIRTAVKRGGRYVLGVGGAVVSDSIPEAEWHETEHKAAALMRAFSRATRRDGVAVGAER